MLTYLAVNAIANEFNDGYKGAIDISLGLATDNIELLIVDDGCGMAPEVEKRIPCWKPLDCVSSREPVGVKENQTIIYRNYFTIITSAGIADFGPMQHPRLRLRPTTGLARLA